MIDYRDYTRGCKSSLTEFADMCVHEHHDTITPIKRCEIVSLLRINQQQLTSPAIRAVSNEMIKSIEQMSIVSLIKMEKFCKKPNFKCSDLMYIKAIKKGVLTMHQIKSLHNAIHTTWDLPSGLQTKKFTEIVDREVKREKDDLSLLMVGSK